MKERLLQTSDYDNFLHSLKIQSLEIERAALVRLYREGRFVENVYYLFESELDIQLDALEYPQTTKVRVIDKQGFINAKRSYRQRLINLKRTITKYPVLRKYFGMSEEDLIEERYQLLRARIITSYEVKDYLNGVEEIFSQPKFKKAIAEVRAMQDEYIEKNTQEVADIAKSYPGITENYQRRMIRFIIQEGGESIEV